MARLFGVGAKEDVERELATEKSYGGMSVAEINQIASISEYNNMLGEDTFMTFSEKPFIDPGIAVDINTDVSKTVTDFIDSDAGKRTLGDAITDLTEAHPDWTEEQVYEAASEKQIQAALDMAMPNLKVYYTMYGDSLLDNAYVKSFLVEAYGMDGYKYITDKFGLVDMEEEQDTTMDTGVSEEAGTEASTEDTMTSDAEETTLSPTEEKYPAQEPLSEEYRAMVEKELSSGTFATYEYSDKYTREQWKAMSREEREELDLPVTPLQGGRFFFRDEIEKFVDEAMSNMAIVDNPTEETYKIKIKGRAGYFHVTKDQLALIPESRLNNANPDVTIVPYEEGEEKAKSISDTRITKLLG